MSGMNSTEYVTGKVLYYLALLCTFSACELELELVEDTLAPLNSASLFHSDVSKARHISREIQVTSNSVYVRAAGV